MPLSRFAFVGSTVFGILMGAAALLAIVATMLWLVGETRSNAATVTDATLMRTALVVLLSDTQEAETGQRGFLLTDDQAYLAPYQKALQEIGPQLDQVRAHLAKNDAQEQSMLDRLASVLKDKLAELSNTVNLVSTGRRDEALAVVKTDRGRVLMEEAREILRRLISRANARVAASVEAQSSNIAALYWVTLAGAGVIFIVVGGSVWAVLVYMRQLIAAEREVQALNIGLEARVKERTADLDRANQEIQRFAYIVTHDLRAPLVNIMGFTSELETSLATIQPLIEQPALTGAETATETDARKAVLEDVPEAIGFIRASTQKMDRLINAILKLSREGRRILKPEPVNLGLVLDACAASIQHQLIERGGEIIISRPMPSVVSDRVALEQIFGNLFDNAVKYRSLKRALKIEVRAREETGRRVIIEVCDNGRGIAAEDMERVFDLFRRSGPQDQPGEGIGLAHVRTMVRNLGGDITLRSGLDRGTTVTLDFPRDFHRSKGAP